MWHRPTTMNHVSSTDPVLSFYAQGLEHDRLLSGPGALEFARTQVLLQRYLPSAPAAIADVGGGPGRYAVWLRRWGYDVHLVDPVPLHITQAREALGAATGTTAQLGDARHLPLPDASVDAVLLLGPLYHLPGLADRLLALREAQRITRPGGVLVAAAISRFASTLDGLRAGYLEDPAFAVVAAADRAAGRHENPSGNPAYFTTAYFHRPDELGPELAAAGWTHRTTLAVEGPAWLLPDLGERLGQEPRRTALLEGLAALEAEPALLGVSAHLLAVGTRA
jgi:ubiquinone/menaquinone biosynthesis C-methylase UbiE